MCYQVSVQSQLVGVECADPVVDEEVSVEEDVDLAHVVHINGFLLLVCMVLVIMLANG